MCPNLLVNNRLGALTKENVLIDVNNKKIIKT